MEAINISDNKPPYLHIFVGDMTDCKKIYSLNELKDFLHLIESERCVTRPKLFSAISESFKFPDYFGHNWDAVDECLSDLEWLQKPQWILLFKDADQLLKKEKIKEFAILIELLNDVSKEWASPQDYGLNHTLSCKPFHLIFQAKKENEDVLLKRLHEAFSISILNNTYEFNKIFTMTE